MLAGLMIVETDGPFAGRGVAVAGSGVFVHAGVGVGDDEETVGVLPGIDVGVTVFTTFPHGNAPSSQAGELGWR